MDNINTLKSFQSQKYSQKIPEPTTVISENKRAPPLNSGQYMKIGGMWNLKHDINSPNFYELFIRI